MRLLKVLVPTVLLLVVGACKTSEPMPVVDAVDLNRFMGDWYVIANIPTFIETDAYNPVETYRLNADGTVATTFAFNKGEFSGERKEYNPKGFVVGPLRPIIESFTSMITMSKQLLGAMRETMCG